MPKPLLKPPRHLVEEWPEVFEDMYMNTMPIHYIDMVRMEFIDGRVWEINVQDQLCDVPNELVATRLVDTFQEFKEDIKKIDFKIDVERLKTDIKKEIRKIL
jgi:hypothetical protein